MKIVAGANAQICAWTASKIANMHGQPFSPGAVALGVELDDGTPIAGVIFHNYHPWYSSIELSAASVSPRWLTKHVISEILAYPFSVLRVGRITAITPADPQTSASRFLRKFGFRQEGLVRKGLGKDDAAIWGLLESEWRFHRYNERRPVDVKATNSKASRSRRRRQRPRRGERTDGARPVFAR